MFIAMEFSLNIFGVVVAVSMLKRREKGGGGETTIIGKRRLMHSVYSTGWIMV